MSLKFALFLALAMFEVSCAKNIVREMLLIRPDNEWSDFSSYYPMLYKRSNCKDPYHASLVPWESRKLLLASAGRSDTDDFLSQGCVDCKTRRKRPLGAGQSDRSAMVIRSLRNSS